MITAQRALEVTHVTMARRLKRAPRAPLALAFGIPAVCRSGGEMDKTGCQPVSVMRDLKSL
jgi:hypothetical protein